MQCIKLAVLCSAALGLAGWPALGHAQPLVDKNVVARQIHKPAAKAPDKYREIYYITDKPATGSHIPVVYRVYQLNGQTLSVSQVGSFNQSLVLRNTFSPKNVLVTLRQEPAFH